MKGVGEYNDNLLSYCWQSIVLILQLKQHFRFDKIVLWTKTQMSESKKLMRP